MLVSATRLAKTNAAWFCVALMVFAVYYAANILGGSLIPFPEAEFNWGGLLATLLFATSHGVSWGDSGIQLAADALIVTAYLGFGLLWIRQRTGSVVIPIIAHNLINVASNVVEFVG